MKFTFFEDFFYCLVHFELSFSERKLCGEIREKHCESFTLRARHNVSNIL
jgi:hypothetical protein